MTDLELINSISSTESLKGEHPGYEIISTSLAEAADELRAMWGKQAAYYDPIDFQYNFDGSARF
jgi:hypothetical protein